jgi:hypothetical protein
MGILTGLLPMIQPAAAAQGELVRASVSTSGAQAAGSSAGGVVSADGRYVVFSSKAANLVSGDTNGRDDIFRFDRTTGQVQAVTVTAAGAFIPANHGHPAVSADGRYVAFWSEGIFDAADPEKTADVFVKDMDTGLVERLTLAPDGSNKVGEDRFSPIKPLGISDDGRWVIFESDATNLVAGDIVDNVPDIFARDRFSATTRLLSTEAGGLPGASSGLDFVIAGGGTNAVVGLRIAAPDKGEQRAVIVNLSTGVQTALEGENVERFPMLGVAAGGGSAILATGSTTVPNEYDVASKTLTPLEDNVDWTSFVPGAFSSDLRYYVASSPNAGFTFRVVDRETNTFAELPRGTDGGDPNLDAAPTTVSDSGLIVAFSSAASNLVFGDTNAVVDIFVVRVAIGTFADDDGNPFEADIEWLASEGITLGCAIDLFCPKAPVTRGQMASFLVRSLDLPASTTDAFTDDAASPHQADINALAEAGITTGCGPGLFCPDDSVTRQQMASFLTRALELPVPTTDFFTDDTGSIHESDINALASRGITLGCAPGLFCPTAEVLREQMAAFLHRAFT